MDKRENKELIAGIRDFLRDVEEPYHHQEWKRFQHHRKQKRRKPLPLVVKLAGIAASLFLMVYASVKLLPLLDGTAKRDLPASKQIATPIDGADRQQGDSMTLDSIPTKVDDINPINDEHRPEPNKIPQAIDSVTNDILPPYFAQATQTSEQLSIPDSPDATQRIKKIAMKTVSLSRNMANAGKPQYTKPRKTRDMNMPNLRLSGENRMDIQHVQFGVNFSPAFTNKGLAFGGGVSAQLPLTSRLSAEIGVSYSYMTVGRDWEADLTNTTTTQVVGNRNAVGMLSIPTTLNYRFTEGFSAAIGLAPFRGVSDRRTDMLQTNRLVPGDGSSGGTTPRLVIERSRSRRPDSLYVGNNYWGFIQLSGRVAPPLLRRHNMVIAPYVGIPVGRLRDDRYPWLHGGVSLRMYLW